MNKTFSIILFFSLIIIGCDSDNEISSIQNEEVVLKSYNVRYSSTPDISTFEDEGNYLLKYKNFKVVKRIGGEMSPASGSGMGGYFSSKVYDTIIYSNNRIEIFTKIMPSGGTTQIVPNKKVFFLDSNQKIIKKINYNSDYTSRDNDTINFEYSNNKISRTFKKKYFENDVHSESFYNYNSNGNLENITTKEYTFNYDENGVLIGREYTHKIIETFENYDSSNNPFKKYGIFDNIYYRSLSRNNYKKYTLKKYYIALGENFLIDELIYNYNINYDTSGNAIFTIN